MIKSISFTQQIGMKSGIQYLQYFFSHSQEEVDVMLFRVTGPVSGDDVLCHEIIRHLRQSLFPFD